MMSPERGSGLLPVGVDEIMVIFNSNSQFYTLSRNKGGN